MKNDVLNKIHANVFVKTKFFHLFADDDCIGKYVISFESRRFLAEFIRDFSSDVNFFSLCIRQPNKTIVKHLKTIVIIHVLFYNICKLLEKTRQSMRLNRL